jgi:hypothetical protein
MKKSSFYGIMFAIVLFLVCFAQSLAAQTGETEHFMFFFAPSESALSAENMDVIDSMYAEGYVISGAIGYANQLPNTRRDLSNDSLAWERALSIQDYIDAEVPGLHSMVIYDNDARWRSVRVMFTKVEIKTIDVVTTSVETAEGDADTSVVTIVDSSDIYFEENVFPKEDSLTAIVDCYEDTVTEVNRQPLEASKDSMDIAQEVTANRTVDYAKADHSNDYCECVEANTAQLWETYLSIQDDAALVLKHHGLWSAEYNDIQDLATQTKLCWEFSRGVRRNKAKLQKHCGECEGKTGMNSTSKRKAKRKSKGRLPFKYTRVGRTLKNLKNRWTRFLDRVAPFRNC